MRIVILVSTFGLLLGCGMILLGTYENSSRDTDGALVSLFDCERLRNPERRAFCEQAATKHLNRYAVASAEPAPETTDTISERTNMADLAPIRPETPAPITPVTEPNPATARVLAALPDRSEPPAIRQFAAQEEAPEITDTLNQIETAAGSPATAAIPETDTALTAPDTMPLDLRGWESDLPTMSAGYGPHSYENITADADRHTVPETPVVVAAVIPDAEIGAETHQQDIIPPSPVTSENTPPHADIVAELRKAAEAPVKTTPVTSAPVTAAPTGATEGETEDAVAAIAKAPEPLATTAPAAGHPAAVTRPPFTTPRTDSQYLIIGSFNSTAAAERLQKEYVSWRAIVARMKSNGKIRHRVVVGPFRQQDLRQARKALENLGILDAWPLPQALKPVAFKN